MHVLSMKEFTPVMYISLTIQKPIHTEISSKNIKAGVNMKAVFWLVITALTQISCLRFKQSRISMLIPEFYVLGRFLGMFGDK